ncbi:MAG: hypothetical protein RBS35_01870 [Azonexus sp.]|nr:hypothetical protein [Azonexus sp.]
MSLCPLCERPLSCTGAYLASADYAGQWFTFPICAGCRQRQARLPRLVRQRQDVTAAHKVIKRPDRYEVSIWQSGDEAKLYARLSADALLRGSPPRKPEACVQRGSDGGSLGSN